MVEAKVWLLTATACHCFLHWFCANSYSGLISYLQWYVLLIINKDARIRVIHLHLVDWLDQQVVHGMRVKHVAVVSASFVHGLGLGNWLASAKRVLSTWVTSPLSLSTWYNVSGSSRLHVSTSWNSVAKALRVKATCGVVHVLDCSSVLASAHDVSSSPALCSSTGRVGPILLSFFIDNCHVVEIIMRQVQMLSHLGLHIFFFIVISWELFNFEILTFILGWSQRSWVCSRIVRWATSVLRRLLVKVREDYFGVAAVRWYFGTYLTMRIHVYSVYVLGVVTHCKLSLSLPRLHSSGGLYLCLLTSARSATRNSLVVWNSFSTIW